MRSDAAVSSPWGDDRAWRHWLTAWALLSIPACCLALLTCSAGAVIALVVLPGAMCGALYMSILSCAGVRVSDTKMVALFVGTTLRCDLVVAAVVGMGTLAPSAALLVLSMLVSSSPVVRRWLRAHLRVTEPVGRHTRVGHEVIDEPGYALPVLFGPAECVGTMSDPELCRAWRRSFVDLQRAGFPREKARIVHVRQHYLDELERRDAAALQAWLKAGARAAGGPERFLSTREQP